MGSKAGNHPALQAYSCLMDRRTPGGSPIPYLGDQTWLQGLGVAVAQSLTSALLFYRTSSAKDSSFVEKMKKTVSCGQLCPAGQTFLSDLSQAVSLTGPRTEIEAARPAPHPPLPIWLDCVQG